jgi:hypothetical protein
MADIKSEPRPASNRNRWPASYWNAWPGSSESAGRVEREEEDGLGDFVRHPPALHRDHTDHLLPNLGGLVFIGKHFAEDRRVDGAGRHRVDANLARNQLGGERPGE